MQKFKFSLKIITLLLGLSFPTLFCQAERINLTDGFSHINIKEAHVQGIPKGSSIQATIDGHYLTVVFTENLGQVAVEITTATGGYVQTESCQVFTFTPCSVGNIPKPAS